MNTIPDNSIWHGRPAQETIRAIGLLTNRDSRGRLYYRAHPAQGWRHLRTRRDHLELSYAVTLYQTGRATT